jgi:dienelactone hydrolase
MTIRLIILTAVLMWCAPCAMAQFPVGQLTYTFTDPNRGNRQIPCKVFYPAESAGSNAEAASGTFPVLVFGHGFVMPVDAYTNITGGLVPEGYIVVLVDTENGFSQGHENFGADLRFVAGNMGVLHTGVSSALFGHIADERAIAGHSMGGGATWLAAEVNTSIRCIIGLAPAETAPSAIGAGESVSVPALVLSGNADGVTPPDDHHLPIYENTASACKYFVNILEGSHCYFAEQVSLCDVADFNPGELPRADQLEYTGQLMLHWLNYHLKYDASALDDMESYCAGNSSLELTGSCIETGVGNGKAPAAYRVYPVPFSGYFTLEGIGDLPADLRLTDVTGRPVSADIRRISEGTYSVTTESAAPGWYALTSAEKSLRIMLLRQ